MAEADLRDTIALELAWLHYRRGAYPAAREAAQALRSSPRAETQASVWFLRAWLFIQGSKH